MKLVIRWKKVS